MKRSDDGELQNRADEEKKSIGHSRESAIYIPWQQEEEKSDVGSVWQLCNNEKLPRLAFQASRQVTSFSRQKLKVSRILRYGSESSGGPPKERRPTRIMVDFFFLTTAEMSSLILFLLR